MQKKWALAGRGWEKRDCFHSTRDCLSSLCHLIVTTPLAKPKCGLSLIIVFFPRMQMASNIYSVMEKMMCTWVDPGSWQWGCGCTHFGSVGTCAMKGAHCACNTWLKGYGCNPLPWSGMLVSSLSSLACQHSSWWGLGVCSELYEPTGWLVQVCPEHLFKCSSASQGVSATAVCFPPTSSSFPLNSAAGEMKGQAMAMVLGFQSCSRASASLPAACSLFSFLLNLEVGGRGVEGEEGKGKQQQCSSPRVQGWVQTRALGSPNTDQLVSSEVAAHVPAKSSAALTRWQTQRARCV